MNRISKQGSQQPLHGQAKGVTLRFCLAVLSSTLGMFSFGYSTGVINAPQKVITAFYNQTYIDRYGKEDKSMVEFLWSFTVAIFAVGGMVGGLAGGWWADKFGRKMGMLYNTAIGIVAGLLMGLSKPTKSFEILIIGRFIVGINCGLYTGLTPTYNSEVSPVAVRGAVGTINQLGVTLALLISQVLGLEQALGTEQWWPLLIALSAVAPLIQLITLPFLPESPRYLLLTKNKHEESVKALLWLRNADEPGQVSEEVQAMASEKDSEQGEEGMSFLSVLRTAGIWKPLSLALIMHLSQQLCGINCIFYYSTTIFEKVGLSSSDAQYATLGVGGIMVVMTIITIPLMDRAGRKTLHLTGLVGIFISSIIFTISFTLVDKTEWLKYLAIVSSLLFVMFFALGPGSIPWMIVAEMFTQGPRSVATALAVTTNWTANFIVGLAFPALLSALDKLVFIPFTVFVFIFFWLIFFFLPETKGRTVDEISALFGKPSSRPRLSTKDGLPAVYDNNSQL